ncbi:MAG: phosphoenolpyruvate-utilizing N-terminal domain-containing protein [Chitinispirillaceae bacterium]
MSRKQLNNQYLAECPAEFSQGLDFELDTVVTNLEQALEALRKRSLTDEAAIVKSHVSRLRNPEFRQRCHRILKRRKLNATTAVEQVVDSLAATIVD